MTGKFGTLGSQGSADPPRGRVDKDVPREMDRLREGRLGQVVRD